MGTMIADIQRATHSIGAWVDSSLRDEGISQPEAHILAFLLCASDATINDAHHNFGHRRSTLTNILDRLESRGLMQRRPNPVSRRSVSLTLTDHGTDVAREVAELFMWLEQEIQSRVSEDDIAAFRRVIRAIEEATE